MKYSSLAFLLLLATRMIALAQECCIQPEINGPDRCTTVEYCNENREHCLGDCEGFWEDWNQVCIEESTSCSPTAPVKCCSGLTCSSVVNNVGVCAADDTPTMAPAPATPRPTISENAGFSIYYFGHSLIYHTWTDYSNTNDLAVPVWLNRFAGWLGDGEFYDPYDLPPAVQWGFSPDISAWSGSLQNYDAIVYTEINYVQYLPPTADYTFNNAFASSPVQSVVRVIDAFDGPVYLYECWNAADAFLDYESGSAPPTTEQKYAYYNSLAAEQAYHQWWLQLYDAVLAERPGANLQFLPISTTLGTVLSSAYLRDVPYEVLFEDNAPHGRPSIYFLAALIQYVSISGQKPSFGALDNESVLVPEIIDNLESILDLIVAEVLNDIPNLTPGPTPAAPDPTSAPTTAPTIDSIDPTMQPSKSPTSEPTSTPSKEPTLNPHDPSLPPSASPTKELTSAPTTNPTIKFADPTLSPSLPPTKKPSAEPTKNPTTQPTAGFVDPTPADPTEAPTMLPPENTCTDDNNALFKVGDRNRSCRWLGKMMYNDITLYDMTCSVEVSPDDRFPTAQEACPYTCNLCMTSCQDDPNHVYHVSKDRMCEYIYR